MAKIWLTSDTHFAHDRDFIWKARGFKNVNEMNKEIVRRWNSVVSEEDTVYHLGDVMLGDNSIGLSLLKQLNGTIYIAFGNHDTQSRIDAYRECHNVAGVQMGYRIKVGKRTGILTHYPTITANGSDTRTLNFFGHTHQTENFYEDRPYMYHVGLDSHDCYPVLLEDALTEIKNKGEK
jgi:calcineurin-like phosphoesterase family protein